MPAKPTPADLLAGGTAVMQAVHAVAEMATAPSYRETDLGGRFRMLCRLNNDMDISVVHHRLFRLTLIRLVFAAERTHRRPAQRDARLGPQLSMIDLMRDQSPEIQKIIYAAHEARTLPDFVRAVDYGPDSPAALFDLGISAVVVLRETLHGITDPMRQWMKVAEVTNQVVATHYLGSMS